MLYTYGIRVSSFPISEVSFFSIFQTCDLLCVLSVLLQRCVLCFTKVGNFNKEVYCCFTVGNNSMFLHWNVANLQPNYQTYKINKIKQNNGRHLQLISVPGLCKNKKCWEKNSFLKLNYANWSCRLGSRQGWLWQQHPQQTH